MQLDFSRAAIVGVFFAGLAANLGLASGCTEPDGGCYWNKVSPVTVDPMTTCLTVTVENPTGAEGTHGGCVAPDLSITNACADALVIDGASVQLLGPDGQPLPEGAGSVSIASGSTGVVEVDLSSPTGAQTLKATLGQQAIEMTFATQLE